MRVRVRDLTAALLFIPAIGCGASGAIDAGLDSGGQGATPPGANAIASDSSGTKLVAVGTWPGDVWTSNNGGVSWIDETPSGPAHGQAWTGVASDATGTKLVAVVNGFYDSPGASPEEFSGDVWTSTDSGVTWTDQTASSAAHGQVWRAVASDASGTNLVAVASSAGVVVPDGGIWTSSDAGVTWTNQTAGIAAMGNQGWQSVASDSNGKNLVAVGAQGVWTSTDGGATWTDHTPSGTGNGWSSVASDATGTRLVAVLDTGDIWTSTDGGVTWTDDTPSGPARDQVWLSVASDSTGTKLAAVDGLVNGYDGDIWTSDNGGLTWTDLTTLDAGSSGPWEVVASNAAGDHLVVIGNGATWVN